MREEIVERRKRAIFVHSHIDTAKPGWEMMLKMKGIVDEAQAKAMNDHIRAAHIGKLLQGLVHGTLPFGYYGRDIPGRQPGNGKVEREPAIDPKTAPWVQRAFGLALQHRMGPQMLARKLNELGTPLPPKCVSGRWTRLAAKTLLENRRYIGQWSYGTRETVLLSGKDYKRQNLRDTPLRTVERPQLRIIDDETFFAVQRVLANLKSAVCRKRRPDRPRKPCVLNGLLKCAYHNRPLVTGGSRGRYYVCPVCIDQRGELYSLLNRELATRYVIAAVAKFLVSQDHLVPEIIQRTQEIIAASNAPSPSELARVENEISKLDGRIAFVLRNPGDTDEDRAQSNSALRDLRAQRSGLAEQVARMKAAIDRPKAVPSADVIRQHLSDAARLLEDSVASQDDAIVSRARDLVHLVTGGVITVSQAGEPRPGRGWIRGTMNLSVGTLLRDEQGVSAEVTEPCTRVELDFKPRPPAEVIEERAKQLFDEGKKIAEIAAHVGYNRNIVKKALANWHLKNGEPVPDFRHAMGRLKRDTQAARLAPVVIERLNQWQPFGTLVRELKATRKVITEAIKVWCKARNRPVIDGRTLRKMRNQHLRGVPTPQPFV